MQSDDVLIAGHGSRSLKDFVFVIERIVAEPSDLDFLLDVRDLKDIASGDDSDYIFAGYHGKMSDVVPDHDVHDVIDIILDVCDNEAGRHVVVDNRLFYVVLEADRPYRVAS
ncbi:hypothetical protein SDC9_167310 [bioreactor metagenome]|uniref:Uncharacterized protein n=1 Tax=bioreactor metagenome TaxID=1076179 RepID=A0A645FZW6_9ZZZZ